MGQFANFGPLSEVPVVLSAALCVQPWPPRAARRLPRTEVENVPRCLARSEQAGEAFVYRVSLFYLDTAEEFSQRNGSVVIIFASPFFYMPEIPCIDDIRSNPLIHKAKSCRANETGTSLG